MSNRGRIIFAAVALVVFGPVAAVAEYTRRGRASRRRLAVLSPAALTERASGLGRLTVD